MSKVNTTNKKKSSNIRKETQLENEALSKKYQKKTQLEHIRDLPDTYIGSIEFKETNEYIIIVEDGKDTIKLKKIQINPGFINIVEEILVNAIDAFSRTEQKNKTLKGKNKLKCVTNINITIDKDGKITIFNNGDGIDIAEHPTEKIYIPQMIFGELLTSGNYDKSEEKITGGKNGYGAKLTNIYSTYFKVETVDRHRKLKYEQEFKNNLDIKETPIITKYKKDPYTQITFIPDYKKFGMETISEDMMALIKKRAYDIVATTNGKVEVSFNGEKISVKDFKSYMSLYIEKSDFKKEEDSETSIDIGDDDNLFVHQVINDRWMVGACLTPTFGFKQVSFVNGINTTRGGKHVDYIIKQFTSHIVSHIKRRKRLMLKKMLLKKIL